MNGFIAELLIHFCILDEDAFNNARLAISIARKLGATIFLVPEDIVEVRSKMVGILLTGKCCMKLTGLRRT